MTISPTLYSTTQHLISAHVHRTKVQQYIWAITRALQLLGPRPLDDENAASHRVKLADAYDELADVDRDIEQLRQARAEIRRQRIDSLAGRVA